jgi:hypothetical protein
MGHKIWILLALVLSACATGPVQDLAPRVAGDAKTATQIAADLGPQSDETCYREIQQAANDLTDGNIVGLITIEAIKRAITSAPTSPCLSIYLDLYASAQAIVTQIGRFL